MNYSVKHCEIVYKLRKVNRRANKNRKEKNNIINLTIIQSNIDGYISKRESLQQIVDIEKRY